jgi:hypothetical protein
MGVTDMTADWRSTVTYKVELRNNAGVLDVRIIDTEEDIRAAVLDIAAGCPMQAGDSITVSEVEA